MLNKYAGIAGVIGAVLIIGAVYMLGYRAGYAAAAADFAQQQAVQEAANREAARLAGERYLDQTKIIKSLKNELEKQIDQLHLEAAADPNAAQCGIGAASSMRLNAIR